KRGLSFRLASLARKGEFLFCKKKTTVFSLFLKREGEAGAFKLQGGSRDGDLIEVKHAQKTVNLPPRWQVNSTPAETEICGRSF
ncbi:hypothetical protein KKF38_02940, partial [Patescibacteria group bacterium]|nr:hypothetical protein [Patescibacteria group bacterium]